MVEKALKQIKKVDYWLFIGAGLIACQIFCLIYFY